MNSFFEKYWKEMLDINYRKAVFKELKPVFIFYIIFGAIILLHVFIKI